jgi:hypothetical protein
MTADAEHKARYQLGRVLLLLGALDLTVLVFVLSLAVERRRLGLSNAELFVSIAIGAAAIILTRISLAIRLRARGGDLV